MWNKLLTVFPAARDGDLQEVYQTTNPPRYFIFDMAWQLGKQEIENGKEEQLKYNNYDERKLRQGRKGGRRKGTLMDMKKAQCRIKLPVKK